jgi:hypothetical protein
MYSFPDGQFLREIVFQRLSIPLAESMCEQSEMKTSLSTQQSDSRASSKTFGKGPVTGTPASCVTGNLERTLPG